MEFTSIRVAETPAATEAAFAGVIDSGEEDHINWESGRSQCRSKAISSVDLTDALRWERLRFECAQRAVRLGQADLDMMDRDSISVRTTLILKFGADPSIPELSVAQICSWFCRDVVGGEEPDLEAIADIASDPASTDLDILRRLRRVKNSLNALARLVDQLPTTEADCALVMKWWSVRSSLP